MRTILVLVALAAAPVAQAVPITLDFSSLAPGDVVTTQFAGVTFSLVGAAPIAGPLVVNPGSTQTAGSGGNLITPTDRGVPCCTPPFFDIRIDFASAIDFFAILALDAEVPEVFSLSAYLDDILVAVPFTSTEIGGFSIPDSVGPIRENTLGAVGGSLSFNRVLIDLTNNDGPEVWDDLTYNVVSVPEPGTLALLSIGLTGLALMRRRAFTS